VGSSHDGLTSPEDCERLSKGFVVDETARISETSQVAKLFAARHQFEFVALHSEHLPIQTLVYDQKSRYFQRKALRLRNARPFGLRHKVSIQSI
jgi:hypothetical protein